MSPAAVALTLVVVAILAVPVTLLLRRRAHRKESAQQRYRRDAKQLGKPAYGASATDIWASDRHGAVRYGIGGGNGADDD